MNSVSIYGRLARDPECFIKEAKKKGEEASVVTRFTVAVDRFGDDCDFIPCVSFGKKAEFIGDHFYKGDRISLTGSLRSGSYEDEDGNTVYTLDVAVWDVEFVDTKEESEARRGAAKEEKNSSRGSNKSGSRRNR